MVENNKVKKTKILLIGIGGVYNYGCEAIVRGTEILVRQEFPDADIVYASYRVDDDLQRLKGSNVKVVKRGRIRRYSIKNIFRKLLSIAGIRWDPIVESLKLLKDVNAVFSIGGDIYTMRPNSAYSMSFPKFGDLVEKRGIAYLLWGASVGPFKTNTKEEKQVTRHLKGLSLITAREERTVEYLRTVGISDNLIPCGDPAFVVAREIKANNLGQQNKKLTIGLNLSPLSIRYTDLSQKQAVNSQARMIENLINALSARIVLIPHSVADFNEGDDDLRYLELVRKTILPKYHEAITIIENDIGFLGTKKELIKCNIVIAARMHCAINALAARVPAIFVSYSRKSIGMCDYVYGHSDWTISLNREHMEDILIDKVKDMMKNEKEIRKYLNKRIPEIQDECYRPLGELKRILRGS